MDSQSKKSFWSAKTGALAMLLSPLLAVSPFLAGALLSLAFCGPDANEGNCGWAALPWFMFITIPAAALMFVTGFVVLVISLFKKST
ncbi:MAG: hypothetical protein EBU89_03840 [Actinobacteria bacterium]|nr:hypothetical protein [Actinomycetota bacterium]